MKLKVGILGATGYGGVELVRILSKHPQVEIAVVTSENYAGKNITEVYPSLLKSLSIILEKANPKTMVHRADLFFMALPHGHAMKIAPYFLSKGKKVVDVSGDFRLKNKALYPRWYKFSHTAPLWLRKSIYGMPELNKTGIKKAQLVANPGCYPTASILSVAPLLAARLVKTKGIIIDAKSGVSGAGRKLTQDIHFSEMNENLSAYKVGGVHQHIPEMEQEMSAVAGCKVTISFTPHLVPLNRGIFATVYASLKRDLTLEKLVSLYQCFYREAPFVRVYPLGKLPAQKAVTGTNYCDIGLSMDIRTGRAVIISAIDNLGKGAAGQAVHNMNLMSGFPETEGLLGGGLYP